MSSILGTWDVRIDGVLGKADVVYEFTQQADGIHCTVLGDPNNPRVDGVHIAGDEVVLDIFVTNPAPSTSIGHLTIAPDGTRFTGQAKRKYLPATQLVGTRRAA